MLEAVVCLEIYLPLELVVSRAFAALVDIGADLCGLVNLEGILVRVTVSARLEFMYVGFMHYSAASWIIMDRSRARGARRHQWNSGWYRLCAHGVRGHRDCKTRLAQSSTRGS
jgi:hypothetical protein